MRKIIIHEFMSLDGVIQAPGGKREDTDGGFEHGGWTIPYWDNEIGKQFGETMLDADTLLLGRKTWETHGAAFDPMPEGNEFGDAMKAIKKVVVSTTLKSADLWRNSEIFSDNIVEKVSELKKQPGKNILIDGSSVLIHELLKHGLIDEIQVHIYPLSLGGGKKLFPEGTRVNLKLLNSRVLSTGVVFAHYQVLNEPNS